MDFDQLKTRTTFLVKRKVFGMGTSMIYDESGLELLVYAKARFLKWHGFKLFGDKEMNQELIFAKRDFGEKGEDLKSKVGKLFNYQYVVTDSRNQELVCLFKRKTWKSVFRDTWIIKSADDTEIGMIQEKGGGAALIARLMPLFFPQKYDFTINDKVVAELRGKIALFAAKYYLKILDPSIDYRILLTGAALISGIEGIQGQQS